MRISSNAMEQASGIQAVRNAEGRLLAPNGELSDLSEQQWRLVRTAAFKEWFGDWERSPENASKVVDENGEPKVVYHGTSRDFSAFDRRMAEEMAQTKAEGEGIFFADRRIVAASYGRRVLPAFLNLRTPYVNENSNTWRQMKLSNGKALTGAPPIAKRGHLIVPADEVPPEATAKEEVQGGEYVSVEVPYPTLASINQVAGWAEASGFDGIIARDIFDMGSDVGKRVQSTTYVAFKPTQFGL